MAKVKVTGDKWIVGRLSDCERLGAFDSEDEAATFISTLPDHLEGAYFLDPPYADDW